MEFKLIMGEMEEAVRALYEMKQSLKTLDTSLAKLQQEIQKQDGKLAKAMNISYGGHRHTVDQETAAVEKLFTYLSSYMEDFRNIDGEIYLNRPSIINPTILRTITKTQEQELHDLNYRVFASHAPPRSMFSVLDDKPDMKANQTHNQQVLEELDRELKHKIRQLQVSEGHELAKTAKKMEQLLQMEQRHASRIEKDYRNYDRNKARQIGAGFRNFGSDNLKGILSIFFHPVQTAKGMKNMATMFLNSPFDTLKLMAYQGVVEPYSNGDVYGFTRSFLNIIGFVGVIGGINKLAKLKKSKGLKPSKEFNGVYKGKKVYLNKTKSNTKTFKRNSKEAKEKIKSDKHPNLVNYGEHYKKGKNGRKELLPNITYITEDGYIYKTDHLGRIISAKTDNLILGKGKRNTHSQKVVGREDRLATDDGGHLFANQFKGSGDIDNLVAMHKGINRSGGKWYNIEKAWKKALNSKPPKKVEVNITPIYKGSSQRPDSFVIKTKIDGIVTKDFILNK